MFEFYAIATRTQKVAAADFGADGDRTSKLEACTSELEACISELDRSSPNRETCRSQLEDLTSDPEAPSLKPEAWRSNLGFPGIK